MAFDDIAERTNALEVFVAENGDFWIRFAQIYAWRSGGDPLFRATVLIVVTVGGAIDENVQRGQWAFSVFGLCIGRNSRTEIVRRHVVPAQMVAFRELNVIFTASMKSTVRSVVRNRPATTAAAAATAATYIITAAGTTAATYTVTAAGTTTAAAAAAAAAASRRSVFINLVLLDLIIRIASGAFGVAAHSDARSRTPTATDFGTLKRDVGQGVGRANKKRQQNENDF